MGLICSCSLISTREYCTSHSVKSEKRVNVHGCMQDVFRDVFLFSFRLTVMYDVTSMLLPRRPDGFTPTIKVLQTDE
jgi:hypothetical protein